MQHAKCIRTTILLFLLFMPGASAGQENYKIYRKNPLILRLNQSEVPTCMVISKSASSTLNSVAINRSNLFILQFRYKSSVFEQDRPYVVKVRIIEKDVTAPELLAKWQHGVVTYAVSGEKIRKGFDHSVIHMKIDGSNIAVKNPFNLSDIRIVEACASE